MVQSPNPPFSILIDRREQAPLSFGGIHTEAVTLRSGDYSLKVGDVSYADKCAVERKSYSDCWGSMSQGRARFERCVQRLSELDRAAIVIECSLTQLATKPSYIERTTPASVVGGLISWSCQYRIPVWICDNREQAARVVLRFLAAYLKHRGK